MLEIMANKAQVNYVGSQAIVTVNNGSKCGDRVNQTPAVRHVTVTPLVPPPTTRATSTPIALRKLLIKAVHKGEKEKKDSGKIFTLRNINPVCVSKVEDLKSLIKAQLSDDLVDRFDVGYVLNNKVVSLRSKEDIRDLMGSVQKGDNILLWCDGLRKEPEKKNARKRKAKSSILIDSSGSDDEDSPSLKRKKEDRDDKVQRRIEELKEKHGQSTYTSMQYRIWAELLSGGVYSSTSDAPTQSTMFMRAGSGGAQKRKSQGVASAQATSSQGSSSVGTSPAKLIENRSKCYKQLADLNNLKQSGLLSDAEYASEREAIMNTLKKLNN